MYKVALFASHEPGLVVLKFLKKEQNNLKYVICINLNLYQVYTTITYLLKNPVTRMKNTINYLRKVNIDCLMSFWPWIISRKLFSHSKKQ